MKKLMCSLISLAASVLSMFGQSWSPNLSMPGFGVAAYGSEPDGFAFLNNVSSLAHYKMQEVSLFSERRFMLNEMQFFSAASVFKLDDARAGVSLDHFGGGPYSRSALGMAYARDLGRVSVGIKFNYTSERTDGGARASTLSAQTGMLVSVTPRLNVGWQISDFPGLVNGSSSGLLPVYRAGAGYTASKDCLIGFELIKQSGFPVNIHSGILYTLRRRLFLKAGVQSATTAYYAGGGWAVKKLQLHVSVSHHPYLGFSPGVFLNHKL